MSTKAIIVLLFIGLAQITNASNAYHKGEMYIHLANKHYTSDTHKALQYLDSCSAELNKKPNTTLLFKNLLLKCKIYLIQGETNHSYTIAKQIEPYFYNNDDKETLSYLHFIYGEYFLQKKRFHESLDEYLQSNLYTDSTHNQVLYMQTKSNIAECLIGLNQYQEAENILVEVKWYAQGMRDNALMLQAIKNLAFIHESDLNKSLGLYKQALELSNDTQKPDIQIAIGKILLKVNQAEHALDWLHSSLSNPHLTKPLEIQCLIDIAKAHELLNNHDSATYYLSLLNNNYCGQLLASQHQAVHYTMAKLEAKEGNLLAAYQNLSKAYSIKDSSTNAQIDRNFKELEESFINKQQAKNVNLLSVEHALQKEKIKQIQSKNILLMSLSVALLILIAIAFYISRKRQVLNDELKHKNAQINLANIELRNTVETRDRLISVIAHDIKNPLGNISGFAELISMNDGNLITMKKYAKIIFKSTTNLQSLLDNLLKWARSQKDNITVSPTHLNVSEVVKTTLDFLKPIADDNHITIENYCKTDHNIHADADTITTIIRNITSNAIKFSQEHSSIYIRSESDEKGVAIHIEDSGAGIKEADIPKLFMQDVDRDSIGNHPNKGTGVGLLLCKEFIDLNKGTIKVESKLGKGSVFTLHFPKSTIDQN